MFDNVFATGEWRLYVMKINYMIKILLLLILSEEFCFFFL